MNPAPTLGNKSSVCPEVQCYETCTPCEHKNYVFEQSTPIAGAVPDFMAVIESLLNVHEEYMQCLCDYELDICKRGELVSFPCLQCGLIDPTCITIGDPVYNLQSCTDCVCFYPLDFAGCTEQFVDLSQAPYTEVFNNIVDSLEKLSGGFANGCTAEQFLQGFLPDAQLLFFKDGTYHFSIGQVPTEILAILPLLANLAPIPLGAKLQYYVACIDPADPFGNNTVNE